MSSAFDYYSETKTGFGFNLKPVLLNRMRPKLIGEYCKTLYFWRAFFRVYFGKIKFHATSLAM